MHHTSITRRLLAHAAAVAMLVALGVGGRTTAAAADAGEARTGVPAALGSRLATGVAHTCAITDTGDVNCWGSGLFGQTGHGNTDFTGDNENPGSAANVPYVQMPQSQRAVALAAGFNHTCALLGDGRVSCWGNNDHGQLGYGNTNDIGDDERPLDNPVNDGYVTFTAGQRVLAISAGGNHTCAITSTEQLICWGDNAHGQLGYGTTNDMGDNETLAGLSVAIGQSPASSLALGDEHTCVVRRTGRLMCWGRNDLGQLGYGNTTQIGDDELPTANPVNGGLVPLGNYALTSLPFQVAAISAGEAHTCAVVTGARVKCWGANGFGQLGLGGTTTIGDNETPATANLLNIGTGEAIASISAGSIHACAITISGATYCWGGSSYGQVGVGTTTSLGDGVGERPSIAVQLPLGLGARAVSAGGQHTCAIIEGNNVTCWGQGAFGQLGYGNPNHIGDNEQVAANPVNGGRVMLRGNPVNGTALATGHGAHTCAILRGAQVACWGANDFGQLGYGNTSNIGDDELPSTAGLVALPEQRLPIALTLGEQHTCALLSGGAVSCWGRGTDGRLGTGNTSNTGDNESPATTAFVQFPGGERAVAIAAGRAHTCALLVSGRVSCWGWNGAGQLGYGNTNSIGDNEQVAANPVNSGFVPLPGNYTARAIAAGGDTTCAVLANRSLTCWGEGGAGQLGYGNTNDIGDNETPAQNPVSLGLITLGGLTQALQVSVGLEHVCLLRTDRQVMCWGSNGFGQLGSGAGTGAAATIGDNETPGDAPNGAIVSFGTATAFSVSAGWVHTCVVDAAYALRCWGAGSAGRLGYGNIDNIGDDEPASAGGTLLNIGGVDQVAASNSHTCDVHQSGIIYCWGFGGEGRLGFGNTGNIGNFVPPGAIELLGVATPLSAAPTEYTPVSLTRLIDTRLGQPFSGGTGDGVPLPANQPVALQVGMRAGVAPDASAVSMNFTVVGATGPGNLRAFLCDTPTTTSTLNYAAGAAVANHTIIALDSRRRVCVQASTAVHLIADVAGYFGPAARVHPISPARLFDTRPGQTTVDGTNQGGGPMAANSATQIPVAGRGGVPGDATAAWLNVVAIGPGANGFVTAYPCATIPNASSLNYVAGSTRANGVLVPLDSSGRACFYTSASTNLLVDVTAYVEPTAPITTQTPARLVDTRAGQTTIDGLDAGGGQLAPNVMRQFTLMSRAGVQPGARAVVLNITGIADSNGFVTVARCFTNSVGSTVNVGPGKAVANTVVVSLFPGQRICVTSSVAAHVIIDLQGTIH